jgi:hypothetical protein
MNEGEFKCRLLSYSYEQKYAGVAWYGTILYQATNLVHKYILGQTIRHTTLLTNTYVTIQ